MKCSKPQVQNESYADPEGQITFRRANTRKKKNLYKIKYCPALSEIFF